MAVDYGWYEQQRRNVETDHSAKQAANDYGRFAAQQRGSRDVASAYRGFQKGWGQNASQAGARGMTGGQVNSGFYQKAMQSYLGDYQRSSNELQQNLASEQRQFDTTQTQMETERQRALAELEYKKQQEIAALATNIQAIRPLI